METSIAGEGIQTFAGSLAELMDWVENVSTEFWIDLTPRLRLGLEEWDWKDGSGRKVKFRRFPNSKVP